MNLTVQDESIYWEAITMIEAQEMLKSMTVSDWPATSKNRRSQMHRDLHKKAYPSTYSKQVTTADLMRIIGGKG